MVPTSAERIAILLSIPDENENSLVRAELTHFPEFQVTNIEDGTISRAEFDLLIYSATDEIPFLVAEFRHLPRIAVLHSSDARVALGHIRSGAFDCVFFDQLQELNEVIVRCMASVVVNKKTRNAALIDLAEAGQRESRHNGGSLKTGETFERIINDLRDFAIMLFDLDGRILTWNTGGERIFGYSAAEVIGKHGAMLFTEEDRGAGVPEEELNRARLTGVSEDDRWHARKDGHRFYASGLLNSIIQMNARGEAEVIGYAKILRDITDRKLADEERQHLNEQISHERERLNGIIDSIPGIVWEVDLPTDRTVDQLTLKDLKLTYISPYVEKLLGYTSDQIMAEAAKGGDPIRMILPVEEEATALRNIQEGILNNGEGVSSYRMSTRSGMERWVEAHTIALKDIAGNLRGLRGVVLDISKRHQAEREREAAAARANDAIVAAETAKASAEMAKASAEAAKAVAEGAMVDAESARGQAEIARGQAEIARGQAEASEQRYRHLAEAMPQIVWLSAPDGSIQYYNRQWVEFTGYTLDETHGSNWDRVIHPDDVERLRKEWTKSIQTKKPLEIQVRFKRKDGNYHWFLTRSVPLFDEEGAVTQWIGTSTDIEEHKHSEESLKFAARASEILSSSLDYQKTLTSVAQLAVPHIADWCSIDVVGEDGKVQTLAVTHSDPEKIKWAREINKRYPPNPNALTGVPQVIRTGKPEFYPSIPREMLIRAAVDEDHMRLIDEIGMTSAMIVPLTAREIVFGAISFISAEAGREFTAADLELAEDLGRRAGLAIDNAWLYQKSQEEIDERTETENALRESEERYRIVAETATDAIITIDESSKILFVNPAAEKIFGYRTNEMQGQDIAMLMPEMYRILHHRGVARYVETEHRHIDWEGVEVPGLRKDGQEIPLEISFGEFIKDGHHIFTGIVRDIAERKRVERELRISESRFRTMIEQSPLGIQLFDLEGFCIKVNHAWEELWSTTRDEVVGYNIRTDTQLTESGMREYVERAYAGEAVSMPPVFYDPQAIGRKGRVRWVRIFLYPVKNEEQNILEVAIIIEDITERKAAEEELQRAKEEAEANEHKLAAANLAKDRFLAILSHELRTPLTPVMATVQALLAETTSEEIRPWLEIIQRNVELEARLIDDLLDLTRITRGKLELNKEVVDLHALLHNVLDIYKEDVSAKELTLMVELHAEHHIVKGDPARLQQVLWNLTKNAVKFTPEGGKFIIHSSNIKQENGPDLIRIEFTDTGIGIDPETLPKIFDAFEQGEKTITRNFGGLGLGLAISKNLVDLHGGTLTGSSPGRDLGATFMVELETTEENRAVKTAEMPEASTTKTHKPIILLIDDHVDTSTAIRMLLQRQGYEVTVANSATEAKKIARNLQYDLIVSDIGLPDESGLVLIGKLREIREAPAIALSGFGTEEDVERSREAGFQVHLTKPFNLQKLRDTIVRLLEK